MFRFGSIFAIALLMAACHGQKSQEAPYFDSLRLVGAMREDELMLLAVRSAKASRNEINEQDAVCLAQYEFHEITDIAARQISEKMSPAEVDDALTYFHGDGGRKLVRRAELEITGALVGAPELSAAEQTELEQFKQRPAGRKLLQDRITKVAAVMDEATTRFGRHVEDCAYRRQMEREAQPESRTGHPADVEVTISLSRGRAETRCKSKPIASLDHVCLANYAAEGNGARSRRASVEVECRHHGKLLTSTIDVPYPSAPVALRWSKSRELEILIQNDRMKIVSSDDGNSAQRFRFASRQPSDPPPLECLPESHDSPPLTRSLPLSITVAAWRAYRAHGLCLMTARVPKEQMSGAEADVLVQFRRQKPAALPFATSDLAFIMQIPDGRNERPLLVDSAQGRLAMIQPAMHMLTGKYAETLLQALTSKPGELTVQPEGAPGYAVPVSRQDFDFAYADFSECLAGLKAT